MPRLLRPLLVLALVAVAAPLAQASTKHGITPLAPRAGATVPAGKSPTFKMRVKGPGKVFVYVCKSRKTDKRGLICSNALIVQAHKRNGIYQVKPRFYNYSGYWLNTPGTYYWQAHRIACENGNTSDCFQEGPIIRFKVG